MSTETVQFSAGGTTLVGHLRLPPGVGAVPAVALSGPFTGVKEQVVRTYAELLTEAGLGTLAFDHRGFGQSEGPRGHEDTQGKLTDLRAAVGLLAAHPRVDPERIGLVGVCLGGGYAVRAAASDPRVSAVAGVAGAYNSPAHFVASMGIESYRAALASFLAEPGALLPAVAPDDAEAAMAGAEPFSYYGTERSRAEHWTNSVTRASLHSLMTFDALSAADLLGATPMFLVHGRVDAYCAPELATAAYERSPGPKEILWLDTREHVDLYDVEPHVFAAASAVADFLHRAL